jgi:AraC family transcriptional regulator of adaptative response/methylated-DNA-[protein]-cysteine methyltransferase
VTFFATVDQAVRAGFRACRRCRPNEADPRAALVRRVTDLIEARVGEGDPVDLGSLALAVDLSPSHLLRVFKRAVGVTPRAYVDACRLRRLKDGLKRGESITGATCAAGYGSSSRIYERAAAQLGMTPAAYRRGAGGALMRYTIVATPVGRLLIAATEKGLCAVSLGESAAELEGLLSSEYPEAKRIRDDASLAPWAEAVADLLDNAPAPRSDLPLDVQATAFQRLVWGELRLIPRGTTRTYREVAAAIGRPEASRAVARACASNRLALVVPCHRVIRGDGSLSGYRWGVERKRMLLDRERETSQGE